MKRSAPGFVLVEIVIALSIVSFMVLVVLGLLSTAIKIDKDSQADTSIALMAQQIVSSLRQQPYSQLPNLANVSTSSPTTLETVFFDINGTRLQDATTSPPQDLTRSAALVNGGIYQCVVAAQGDVQTAGLSASSPCLLLLTLTFTWPLQASSVSPNSFTLHASLADYR